MGGGSLHDLDSIEAERILALVPNWLGDAVMCTPALRTLHRRFPQARLAIAGRAAIVELLRGLPYIYEAYVLPKRPGPVAMARIGWKLRPAARDLAVVFPHSLRAAVQARLAGSRRILGYARNSRSWLLTDTVAPNVVNGRIEPEYMVWEYLDLLAPLGCEYDGFGMELKADAMAVARVKEHLVGEGPFVGIAPGAAFGPSKRWPVERFAAVADRLAETGAQCLLLTGPGEEATRDAIRKLARHELIVCDEGRPTVDTLKATVSLMTLLVCNDSGPRHVAIAMGVPAVCVMGPTQPVYTEGPYETGRVLRVEVDCGPCQKPICATDHRCMTQITPEEVAEAALGYLPKARV
jgi:heptosyltransferase-2